MERKEVYAAIDSEREYQEKLTADSNHPEMRDISLGETAWAIEENLNRARDAWYYEAYPYPKTMEFFRKIAALAVRTGENCGMPKRETT